MEFELKEMIFWKTIYPFIFRHITQRKDRCTDFKKNPSFLVSLGYSIQLTRHPMGINFQQTDNFQQF